MKTIYWTPDSKKYTALKCTLINNIVSVHLLDGSIRKVSLQECSDELQKQLNK